MTRAMPACASRRAWLAAACAAPWLAGCARWRPVRVGVLLDLTGRFARLNEDGANGVLLAVEQVNRAGGVQGRRLDMLVRDSRGAPGKDSEAAEALLAAGVDLVIGPFSSGSADRIVPLFNAARVLLLCPTSTDVVLTGRDDQLLRLNRNTQDSTLDYADWLHARGLRRLALATDMRSHSNSAWRGLFRDAFGMLGGQVVADAEFGAAAQPTVNALMRQLLAARPDGLVFSASGVDAARLAQQALKLGAALPMAAPDWADTQALFEVGGRAVEGMLVSSACDVGDTSARYRAFLRAYGERFGMLPSYRSIAAHDAVTVLVQALQRAAPNESLRDAVLRRGPYQGLQQPIVFDRYGDAARRAYHRIVRNGRFEPQP
ncbi:ABC transporter substrate-binding protein [Pseudorhodoferax sp.]|uniref:ABC transporter substrate-binding protein n=1 Tax=Pseudorhodoferax sp. TaxID=1993553 RepID=UPI002DD6260F|nr:ABC transporter substrate-binding protein [Pseudorhodoferax sp.]